MSKSFDAKFPTVDARRAYYREKQREWRYRDPANMQKKRDASKRWHLAHKEQQAEYRRYYRAMVMTDEQRQRYSLRRAFGVNLAPEQREVLLLTQCGKCAICGYDLNGRMHVDHDHRTGEIRGLLCSNCNTGIGLLREDARVLQNALDYLAA